MSVLNKYIEHCAGIYNFLSWLEEETKEGMPYEISNQVIYFNSLISRYFSLGVATHKKTNEVFLAIQPTETEWFSLIEWDKVILKNNDSYIYFLSKTMKGDQQNYPDLPAFAFALYVDTKDKLDILQSLNKLSGREYYRSTDNGEIHVNFHKKIFSLPIETYTEEQTIVLDELIFDCSEILSQNEQSLQGKYTGAPEFMGDTSAAAALIEQWDKKQKEIIAYTKKVDEKLNGKW